MWATTKAIMVIGAAYFVAGAACTAGLYVGLVAADKLSKKLGWTESK